MLTITCLAAALHMDARFALRAMRRRLGWTTVAVLTLATGIAAATTVFTVLDALILHPLLYAGAERVFEIQMQRADLGIKLNPTPGAIAAWREDAHTLDAIEPIPTSTALVVGGNDGTVALVQAVQVLPSFFSFANHHAILGRAFDARDEAFSAGRHVLLGESFWRAQFGADPAVIGRRIVVDSEPATIIGVASKNLHVPGERAGGVGIWSLYDPTTAGAGDAAILPVRVIGRLRPGVSIAAAGAELDTIARRAMGGANMRGHIVLTPIWQLVRFRTALQLLAGAVALVLLLACGNVAHMLLARGAARRQEVAIRAAIGATTTRLWLQLVVEATMLVLMADGIAILLAAGTLRLLATTHPAAIPELDAVQLDMRVLMVALVVSVVTGVLFGTLQLAASPARQPFGARAGNDLSLRGGPSRSRGMRWLIATEATMAFIILIGASSLVRAVMRLADADPGLQTHGLLAMHLRLPGRGAPLSSEAVDALAARIRRIPGVVDLTFARQAPPDVGPMMGESGIEIEGRAPLPRGAVPRMAFNGVARSFFAVAGLRFVTGGPFTDTSAVAHQMILSESTARRFWPGGTPIGARFRFTARDPWSVVVGVVGDVAAGGLAPEAHDPVIYVPLADHAAPVLLIRSSGAPGVVDRLRLIASSLNRTLPPPTITRVDDAMAQTIARPAFAMRILTTFAELCLLLTALGVYGVLTYAVEQRRKEIGIRLALGGSTRTIGWTILAQALWPTAVGMCVGMCAIPWMRSLLAAAASGTAGTTDAFSIVGAVLVLAAAAVLAAMVPAWRAMHIDPASALRTD